MEAIKDLITCGVCLEIFTDPQLLPCLHTLCRPCLQLMCKEGELQCPECRSVASIDSIKNNFHTQSLVDIYKQNARPVSAKARPRSNQVCQICVKGDLAHKCVDCNKLICSECSAHHLSIPSCSAHSVLDISDVCTASRNQLSEFMDRLLVMQRSCQSKLSEIKSYSSKLRNARAEGEATIDREEQDCLNKVKEAFDSARAAVKLELGGEERKLAKLERRAQFAGGELKELLELVHEISQTSPRDPARLIVATGEMCVGSAEQFQELEVSHMVVGELSVSVEAGQRDWRAEDLVRVEVTRMRECSDKQYGRPLLCALLDSPPLAETRRFTLQQPHKSASILRLCALDSDAIVALHEDAVAVYSVEGALRATIQHEQLRGACALAVTPARQLVVACGDDSRQARLLEFDTEGALVATLPSSSREVIDLAAVDKRLFALTNKKGRVDIYSHAEGSWEAAGSITYDGVRCSSQDTLLATSISVLICSYREGRLIEYTHAGDFMHNVPYYTDSGSGAPKEKRAGSSTGNRGNRTGSISNLTGSSSNSIGNSNNLTGNSNKLTGSGSNLTGSSDNLTGRSNSIGNSSGGGGKGERAWSATEKRLTLTCSADAEGAALCLDQRRRRMVVLDAHRQWSALQVDAEWRGRVAAVMDGVGRLWVAHEATVACYEAVGKGN